MHYLVYLSTALVPPRSTACRDIVDVSIRNNARVGLTGFLHAEEGLFIQYLEGPDDALWTLYDHLHTDPRHRDLRLLGDGGLWTRRFQDWRMGYSAANVLSLSDFLAEISDVTTLPPHPTRTDAIAFLMAASLRLDLGISDSP